MNSARILAVVVSLVLVGCGPKDSATVVSETRGPHNAALGYRIDLKETTNFTTFPSLNQVVLTPEADQLVISAAGSDPSIVLPPLALTPPVQFALRIEMTAPAETLVEVFYSTNTVGSFVPDHVVSVPAKAGRSVLLFEINDPEFSGGVRFDPGQAPGKYILHGLELFASAPFSLAKPTPTPVPSPSAQP
jgi:hypothetical protein